MGPDYSTTKGDSSYKSAERSKDFHNFGIDALKQVSKKGRISMKLTITRNQASGMFGGVKFELVAKVTLTPEESAIISKYKADKEVLLKKEVKIPLTGRALTFDLTIGSLMTGQTFKCNDIAEILEYEKNAKESCESFRNYLAVMQSFGGQEVIEY